MANKSRKDDVELLLLSAELRGIEVKVTGSSSLRVRIGASAQPSSSELVLAWARDIASGEPRYILELDEAHRGAKCGCECPSCGAALTGVNVAKDEFEVRPHFRHPPGAQRRDCLVLASRLALLRQFQNGGWLELPSRRMPATVQGLSGAGYNAWAVSPPQKLHIIDSALNS